MRIISKRTLREFWERRPDAKAPLENWYTQVRRADWTTPSEIRENFPEASFVGGNRVVFNIRGNRLRLVAWISYRWRTVHIKWIGTHTEYDRIDVERVGL